MKLRLHPSIPHSIHLQLEAQPRAIHNHLQREVQVIKLDSSRSRQSREEAPWDGIQVRRECAHMHQVPCIRRRRVVGITGDEIVGYDEGLAGTEVAGVMEGDGGQRGESFALHSTMLSVHDEAKGHGTNRDPWAFLPLQYATASCPKPSTSPTKVTSTSH